MTPRDDTTRKKKKIEKYPTSNISRKLKDKPAFQCVESSSQEIANAQRLHQTPQTTSGLQAETLFSSLTRETLFSQFAGFHFASASINAPAQRSY